MILYAIERMTDAFNSTGILMRGMIAGAVGGIRLYTNRQDAERDARRYAANARGLAAYRVVHADLDGEPGMEFLYDPVTHTMTEFSILQNQDCEVEAEVEECGGVYWLDPVKWHPKSGGKMVVK